MSATYESICNHHERSVFEAIAKAASRYANVVRQDLLADVACVALNRLPPRYIRHEVDMAFYFDEREREETARSVEEAVSYAFEFVQARSAMRARG